MEREIRIYFTGFWKSFDFENNFITRVLGKRYRIAIDKINPEYVFFTGFDSEIYKYNCVRIFYNAENFAPDFNLCDYALGFDEICFGDRYLRYPLYLVPDYTYYAHDNYARDFERANCKQEFTAEELVEKTGFCGMVVSRGGCEERDRFFELLSAYKPVASGGRWKNNVGGPVADKDRFLQQYKFSIAFENSSTPGYTTEKLMQAFGARTLPIYYGNPHIAEEFNERAFVNAHRFSSWDEVVSEVARIDADDRVYLKMMQEPAFVPGYVERKHEELEKFLFHIVEQSPEEAVRRHGPLIRKYEKKYKIGTILYRLLVRLSGVRYRMLHLWKR